MEKKKINTPGIIGIDAGGTYTDLVFLNGEDQIVEAKAKTPTIHDDLVTTIENGLDLILEKVQVSAICSFNLATTLATNAIVENRLRPTALLLIGYHEKIVQEAMAKRTFNTDYVFMVEGGHNQQGDERKPLDEAELRRMVREIPENIEAVAVSAFFSVRNTSHENRAVEIIRELRPDLYLSCGHELATDLDAVKRATTTVLNAGLIPIVMELLASVERVCKARGIEVPITIVRGDGTIVGAPWARMHPVEMVLSGPAGSACGARFLASADADQRGTWVVDIGGTTTDIIRLDASGKPVLLEEGATVAGHKTLVKAIDIYTFGLGGDTRVLYYDDQSLVLGNRRVRPLCALAGDYPQVLEELKSLHKGRYQGEPLFLLAGAGEGENEFEKRIAGRLKDGPRSVNTLLAGESALWLKYRQIEKMEEKGLVRYASFTPTDALHVLGILDVWNKEASLRGARLMTGSDRLTAEDVAASVRTLVVNTISKALLNKSFAAGGFKLTAGGEGQRLIEEALTEKSGVSEQVQLLLAGMLVGVGAPSWAFVPLAGDKLHERTCLPENADVAGAVGAAVGTFSLVYSVRIMPLKENERFRVHYPLGISDFESLDEAIDFAETFMKPWLVDRAFRAGAKAPRVGARRFDKIVPVTKNGLELYLYTQLSFDVMDGVPSF